MGAHPPKEAACEGCGKTFISSHRKVLYCDECPSKMLAPKLAQYKKRGEKTAFDLDMPFLIDLYEETKGRCSLSGIPFYEGFYPEVNIHPFAPSLDKIRPSFGYTKGNVRWIVHQLNTAFGDFGQECFDFLVTNYMEKRFGR